MPEVVLLNPEFVPPSHFDGFSVERPLGRGGMGHVYLGRDTELDRLVALKFVAAREGSATARERFRREARAIARLSHPNVVSIYRIGEVADQPYIAYELVPGRSLDRTVLPLPWPVALRIAVGIARGLEAVHRAGIFHRDLKPANVVLSDAGDVKLIDFGLASLAADGADVESKDVPSPTAPTMESALLTRPGAILGTPAYIAPEQWCGEPATMRSDVYAFGMTLLELLTGNLPHARLPFDEIRRFVLLREFPSIRSSRPDVPESFASTIDRCLRRDPAERFASGAEIRAVLETAERLFVHAGAASPAAALALDSNHVAVASSFVRVKSKGSRFAESVYARLFDGAPDVRALFPRDMTAQQSKLVHMIEVALDSLSAPDALDGMLADLGRRHVHYGAKAEHFEALWTAMLGALAEHEEAAWTPELAAAWKATFKTLEERMRRGMEVEKATVLSGVANVNVLRLPPPIFDLRSTPAVPDSWKPPRTQYARGSDADLAFQVIGEGPVDIVVMTGWLSHVELNWGHRSFMTFLRELGQSARVIVYDKRGTGLSDRTRESATLDDHVGDLIRVCDAAKCERPVLFGISDGSALAIVASTLHPERFSGLVLHGASPRWLASDDFAHGLSAEQFGRIEEEVRTHWGEPVLLDVLAPSLATDPAFREWMGLYMRMSASPTHAWAAIRDIAGKDIRALVPHAGLPALVVHRENDRLVPVGAGRYLARTMPNAELFEQRGEDHLPFVGDSAELLARVREFVAKRVQPEKSGALPIRTVAAFRHDDDAASGRLAHEIATALGGSSLGAVDGVTAYAFMRAGHAVLFLQRLRESLIQGTGPFRELQCAVDATWIDPSTTSTAVSRVTELLDESAPGRVPIGPLAGALLGSVRLERDEAGRTSMALAG